MLTMYLTEIADFMNIYRISLELCLNAISTLISLYLLLFE